MRRRTLPHGTGFRFALAVAIAIAGPVPALAHPEPGSASPEVVTLRGQVVCSVCWYEADRAKVAYGNPGDLACAARCAGKGVPMALAVKGKAGASDVTLYLLSPGAFQPVGTGFLAYVSKWAEVRGTLRRRDPDKEQGLVVDAFQVDGKGEDEAGALPAPAPPLEATDLSGTSRSLSGLRGRVVVVNFWSTWCLPCREEMPLLSTLSEEYGPLGVTVLGVSVNGDREEVRSFASSLKLAFSTWYGATGGQMRAFGLGLGLPATAVVDAEGRIVARIRGMVTRESLTAALDAVLKSSGKSPGAAIQAAGGATTP